MDNTDATKLYAKRFIPLESDPLVLNDLMYGLGVSGCLTLTDVWSIDDALQLSTISRPVYALILVLPTCEEYERHRRSNRGSSENTEDLKGEEIVWIQQTIDMACGLYAILHATCNSATSNFIVPNSLLGKLVASSNGEREALLESSTDVEEIYRKAALRGHTAPPPPEEEVDLHYVCFIKSPNGSVYEMDGDAIGPVKTDVMLRDDQDLLESSALECSPCACT
ncbi:hypothetical protein N7G274_005174 [Stereocaulon virgatum]|uniref:Ubiquitin carboxyl-terminal hydrolase n=1 Tax=Stereocaulon virgatum TaxID=373712 RepID=A0ABR4AAS5_9LECA